MTSPVPGLRFLRELGRGAQGVVHLAREADTGELVAVKVLTPVADPHARETFRRELDCTAALRHPNIVRFRRSHAEPLAFTAEYCPGGSVADVVTRDGPMPAAAAVPLIRQALAGLAHAHTAEIPVRLAAGGTTVARGLVHRDLKPQNLLLGADGRLKVADFGLAKAYDLAGLSGRTPTGAIGGSLAFMPRRQLVDYKYARPAADLWALTACLYWLVTGATPRDFRRGTDPVAVVLREPAVPVHQRGVALPPRLAALIDDVLSDADSAPQTATDLAGALLDLA
ncbi:serine/threonine protein kinase [Actinoplanes octamycinicus]|uniref:non-specific serine/threonine protein kinase n=1 Tax=Actinoplanes octamycinicus TaxID=135948 RepID=A0A7W7H8D5_9ACTN|nr:serine/threonine-protein kinase [Actinoplanes octamycinicus]MBB4745811.1 serine/threonine protein kinase [Actinoplanes octamycinicus]GIE63613.1 hypothetical protein Aoc01nite_90150 [Actinoplanes octamycinicus]